MGSGLHTTDNAMMRENQARDLPERHARNAVGLRRGPTIDEIPESAAARAARLVQPGTDTPATGLANVVNGHNMPGENAPQSALADRPDRAPR